MKTPLLFILGLVSLATLSADERRDWDRDNDRGRRREEPRVILFEHADFRGDSIVLYPGDALDNFSGRTFESGAKLNDSVSSIVIEGGAELYVYENGKFRGQALRVTESVRDLTGRLVSGTVDVSWNDRISSAKVERARGSGRPDKPGRPNDNPRGDPDKVINATFKDILDRNPDPGELRDFHGRFLDQGWNERLLRDHLHNEERYRIEWADRLIKRAYLDVLGREADAGGLKTYRRNMFDRKWSESDVRDDLRKSTEYRSKQH